MKVRLKSQSGASAVEFALILPILLLLVFGIIEMGFVLFDKAMITNASREGARTGISYRVPPFTDEEISEEISKVVKSYLGNALITFAESANPTVTVTKNSSTPRDELKVTVAYTYTSLILPNLINSPVKQDFPREFNMIAETTMRME
jgi:Flp pilus assembly protein TadG